MSREKQIEEMLIDINEVQNGGWEFVGNSEFTTDVLNETLAEHLYNADYRKQSEVIDEFVELLKKEMNNLSRMEYHCDPYFLVSKDFVDRIATKMKGGAG